MRRALAAGILALLFAADAAAQLPARWARSPLTEVARAQVRAELAWERYGLTGEGTVLCLIDTGADTRHADLRDGSGAARARWVLDSLGDARGVFPSLEERFGGAVWRGDEAGIPGDSHGHGTAMASIAIGDGGEGMSAGPHAGLAPSASLIVVRAYDPDLGGFPDDAVVNGVRFCRAAAAEDDGLDEARMVVLLSLGGHDGSHDGEGAFERALSELAREVPIVVAAGNDGERAVRATGRVFEGERTFVGVQIPRSDRVDAELALTVRAGAPFVVESPDGARTSPLGEPGAAELSGARVRVEAVEGERSVLRVVLAARNGALAPGGYHLELAGPAVFEVWLAGARLGPTFFAPSLTGPHVRAGETITIPATASRLIAVGATVSRGTTGTLHLEGEAGARAAFSSLGPAPSGAPKPDLVAPGGWILAALSSDVRDGDPENLAGGSIARFRTEDGRVAVRGTSAAAAVVAGALLLALELDPSRAAEARALLAASARGERAWTPGLGAGELDVGRLLEVWSGAPRGSIEHGELTATRSLAIGDPALWLVARGLDEGGAPAGSALSVTLNDRVVTIPLEHGAARFALAPPPLTVGAPVIVEASIDGAPLAPITIPVLLDRSDSGAVRAAGGGCSAHRSQQPHGWLVLAVTALLLSSPRLRRVRQRRRCHGRGSPSISSWSALQRKTIGEVRRPATDSDTAMRAPSRRRQAR